MQISDSPMGELVAYSGTPPNSTGRRWPATYETLLGLALLSIQNSQVRATDLADLLGLSRQTSRQRLVRCGHDLIDAPANALHVRLTAEGWRRVALIVGEIELQLKREGRLT